MSTWLTFQVATWNEGKRRETALELENLVQQIEGERKKRFEQVLQLATDIEAGERQDFRIAYENG